LRGELVIELLTGPGIAYEAQLTAVSRRRPRIPQTWLLARADGA
jgi:hypothetical protein